MSQGKHVSHQRARVYLTFQLTVDAVKNRHLAHNTAGGIAPQLKLYPGDFLYSKTQWNTLQYQGEMGPWQLSLKEQSPK